MTEDTRCCGTGTCLIDAEGRCWCGQQWDGEKMCRQSSNGDPSAHTTDNPAGDANDAGDDPA
jgi:hypothetical protein